MTAIEILVYGIEGLITLVVIGFFYKSFKKMVQAEKEMRQIRADLERGYPLPDDPWLKMTSEEREKKLKSDEEYWSRWP